MRIEDYFFEAIGVLSGTKAVYQSQIHSANITIVDGDEGIVKDSDALITSEQNVLLGVTVADCTPILLYDPVSKVIAAVHAGWRGTEQMIGLSAVRRMMELGAMPENLFAFIGASASGEKYEVGLDVATLFEEKNLVALAGNKFLLDVKGANLDQLLFAGIPHDHIEISPLCTITDERLHSFRRDGKRAGRMLAVIMRKDVSFVQNQPPRAILVYFDGKFRIFVFLKGIESCTHSEHKGVFSFLEHCSHFVYWFRLQDLSMANHCKPLRGMLRKRRPQQI